MNSGQLLGLENHVFEDIRRFALRPGFAVSRTEPAGIQANDGPTQPSQVGRSYRGYRSCGREF